MCMDPVTLAVVGIAGGVISGIGAASQHNTNARSAEMQAAGLRRDAQAEKEASAFEVARTKDELARLAGKQRANFSANGVALSGSAAEVIRDSATEGQLDIEAILWNSKSKQDALKYGAKVSDMNASASRAAAPIAFLSSTLGGVARFGGAFAPK